MNPIIIHFVCPNQDCFHGLGEYVSYLLVPGWKILQRTKEGEGKLYHSYTMAEDPNSFILMDDPTEEWLTAIGSQLVDAQIFRYPHLCLSCRHKGVKS